MGEPRRATAALAALVGLAVGAAVLLSYHLVQILVPQVGAAARFCRLPVVMSGPDRAAAIPGSTILAVGLLLAGVGFAAVRLVRSLRSTRRVAARLAAAPASAVTERVAARAAGLGLPISPVVTELDDRPAAFTIGWLRPRVVVSTAVVEALTDAELDALLLHEAAHASRRDPLRLAIAGFCRDLLFFLPISHALFLLAAEAQERAADDAAAAAAGPLEVASALLAVLKLAGRRPAAGLATAAAGADPEARIRRLLDTPSAHRSRRTARLRAGASVLVSAALLAGLAGAPAGAVDAALAGCCAAMTAAVGTGVFC